MNRLFLFALLVCVSNLAFTQSSVRDLEKYMTSLRNSPHQALPGSVLNDSKNEKELLGILTPFYSDTLRVIRQKAFYITKRIGQKSNSPSVQKSAIDQLVQVIRDRDTGISGNAIEALTGFPKQNFSNAAKDSIGRAISLNTPHLDELLKLAGFLDLEKFTPAIESVITSGSNAQVKWAARLSLARMGDEAATSWITNKLQSARVNDDFVYEIVPDLVYTRQLSIFKYLEKIVYSDEENCQSPNPDSSKKILCGYRVMESMAPYIKDFPVKVDVTGDLLVNDYPLALKEVRAWFVSNPTYSISEDSY